jgi:hypothetical protein
MENEKKNKLFEEQLRKFKYRVDYKVNESPKYRPLVGMSEEFDEMPMTNEAGEQEDAEKAGGGEVPPAPSNDQPIPAEVPPAPEGAEETPAPEAGATAPEGGGGIPADMSTAQPEVDNIQNEIIKHNIEAMKSIHDQLEGLSAEIQKLNAQSQVLAADVAEVREPTNSEKLMSKSKVSYPYYFNLNDFWSGNWFSEQREKELSKGIKEMPDGTYVADFDDLPQKSKFDVQNSFNEI